MCKISYAYHGRHKYVKGGRSSLKQVTGNPGIVQGKLQVFYRLREKIPPTNIKVQQICEISKFNGIFYILKWKHKTKDTPKKCLLFQPYQML